MTSQEDLVGRDLVDHRGEKIGTVQAVHPGEPGEPVWLEVSTGWFGTRVSFVPHDATWERGDHLTSRWDKDVIRAAPHRDTDGTLSAEERRDLYHHYGLEWVEPGQEGHLPAARLADEGPEPVVERRLDVEDEVVLSETTTQDGRVVLEAGTPDGPTITAELHEQSTAEELEGDDAGAR